MIGDDVVSAYGRLRRAGFAVGIDEPINVTPNGVDRVARQSIAPGRKADHGRVVSLELERGPYGLLPVQSKPLQAPQLIGTRLDSAARRLQAVGLSWAAPPLTPPPSSGAPNLLANYLVRDQKPQPGSRFVQTVVTPFPGGIRTATTTVVLFADLRSK